MIREFCESDTSPRAVELRRVGFTSDMAFHFGGRPLDKVDDATIGEVVDFVEQWLLTNPLLEGAFLPMVGYASCALARLHRHYYRFAQLSDVK